MANVAESDDKHGSLLEPFINWMIVNIPYNMSTDMSTSDVILPYKFKPLTVNKPVWYAFRVYKQQSREDRSWADYLKLFSNEEACVDTTLQLRYRLPCP